ncbi:MAG TPA: bifunctional [glutamate--ammonia ligase]-adenylyl-L-tyrosine phosphorylase/[glutamate--ammonia-ligase] adenylyltransferase, partial [Steroidobacteraceae bacterium]|nr:bifunctional [glutamate--ammonia ligase]-adenylyl-L-tyrosine phosphorylase/[glutamate--ammonia-ligase] adenylyltransferase [Steroidobacteraceae bacterium]
MQNLPTLKQLPEALATRVTQQLSELKERAAPQLIEALSLPDIEQSLPLVWASSEFVMNNCVRNGSFLPSLIHKAQLRQSLNGAALNELLDKHVATATDDAEFQSALRQFRHLHLARIAWRDIAGWAALNETLLDLSNLADVCVQSAYVRAYKSLSELYGAPVGNESNTPQHLMILGMGKLGGRELNYSSDIDLIFLFPEHGDTNGAASISNEEFFLRLGQRVIQHLANKTVDGFVFRVDMRLRPFGDSGPLVMSFDGFEDYLQQHGRDWERYAFVKARPITAIDEYTNLYSNVVRPFVYRRYLDFSVFEALREMKQMIAREVERRDLQDNVKLGRGGIREVEFIVQAFQLLRAGNDRNLQSTQLQLVLPQLVQHKLLTTPAVNELLNAYRFLRLVENRLQQWNDHNTHQLPEDDIARMRLAVSLGYTSWTEFLTALDQHRDRVSHWFGSIVFGGEIEPQTFDSALTGFLDPGTSDDERWQAVASLGIKNPQHITSQMLQIRESSYYQHLDEVGKRRLHLLVPRVLRLLATVDNQEESFSRLLRILEKIGRRTTYLAMLFEQPTALQRMINLCSQSEFLAQQMASFPLLLDELNDTELLNNLPTRESIAHDLQ